MPHALLSLTVVQARQFMQLATGLDGAYANVAQALDHLGYVQIDPINVCGRMQDHILRHRVRDYQEHGLMRHLYRPGQRDAFEHHLPDSSNLVAMPMDAWPYLLKAMRDLEKTDSLWSGRLTAAEQKLAKTMLQRMATEGPLCSQDIASERKAKSHAWDSTTVAKSTLLKLFFHGRVLLSQREGNRRYYDLREKIVPAAVLNSPEPTHEETLRWLAHLKLRQRRLALLKSAELRAIVDEVVPIELVGHTTRLHLLRSDLPLLEASLCQADTPRLIAPLDPIIYDRRVTELVWGYDYRWEVYVPPHKRVRGYYALPLLHKGSFIGHVDSKADRRAGKLTVVSQVPSRSIAAKSATASLAKFLDLR